MRQRYRPTKMGRIFRAQRKQLSLTLAKCALVVGVSRQAISQIEMGKNRGGNSKVIEALAQFLKLDFNNIETIRPKRRLCKKKRETALGSFLTRQRLKSHLSQNEVARWAGVSRSISDIERGKTYPRHSTLEKITWVLECEIPEKLLPLRPWL